MSTKVNSLYFRVNFVTFILIVTLIKINSLLETICIPINTLLSHYIRVHMTVKVNRQTNKHLHKLRN